MLLPTLTLAAAMTVACQVKSPPHTVALVELFTSQGCSSCPPADRWLSALHTRLPGDRAIPLALHVGYWDYIGWKDPFAKREFNERQRWLAELNGNRTVYTPGVFLHARETPRWSDASRFESAVRAINAKPARADIELAIARGEGDRVEFKGTAKTSAQAPDGVWFVALTQSGLATSVKAGENRGETLHNDHVTRDWTGPLALGAQALSLSAAGARREQLSLVAFVQDRRSGDVLQVVRQSLSSCR